MGVPRRKRDKVGEGKGAPLEFANVKWCWSGEKARDACQREKGSKFEVSHQTLYSTTIQ